MRKSLGSAVDFLKGIKASKERWMADRDDKFKEMTARVNKIIDKNKLVMPPTEDDVKFICQKLNLKCNNVKAIEVLMWCKGRNFMTSQEFD